MENFAYLCVQGEEVVLVVISLSLPHPWPSRVPNTCLAFRQGGQVPGGLPCGSHSDLAHLWGSRIRFSHGNAKVGEHPRSEVLWVSDAFQC